MQVLHVLAVFSSCFKNKKQLNLDEEDAKKKEQICGRGKECLMRKT